MTVNTCGKCKKEYFNKKLESSTTKLCNPCKRDAKQLIREQGKFVGNCATCKKSFRSKYVIIGYTQCLDCLDSKHYYTCIECDTRVRSDSIVYGKYVCPSCITKHKQMTFEEATENGTIWQPVNNYTDYGNPNRRTCRGCTNTYVSFFKKILMCETCSTKGCICSTCNKRVIDLKPYSTCDKCWTREEIREKIQNRTYEDTYKNYHLEVTYKKKSRSCSGYDSDTEEITEDVETYDLVNDFKKRDLNYDHTINPYNPTLNYYYGRLPEDENRNKYGTKWEILNAFVVKKVDLEADEPIDF